MNRITKFINLVNEYLDPLGDLAKDENFRGEVLAAAGAKEKKSEADKAKTKEKMNRIVKLLDDLRKKLGLDKSDIPEVDNIAALGMLLAELYLVYNALREMLETCDYFGLEDNESDRPDEDKETAVANAVRAVSRMLTRQVLKKKAPRVASFAEAAGFFSDEYTETKRALDLFLFPVLSIGRLFSDKANPDLFRPTGDEKADDQQRIVRGIFLIASVGFLWLDDLFRPAGTFLFNFGYEPQPGKDPFPNAAEAAERMLQVQFLPGKSLAFDEDEYVRDEFRDLDQGDAMMSFATLPVFKPGAGTDEEPEGFQYLLNLEVSPSDIGETNGPVSVKFHPGFSGNLIWGHGINLHAFSGVLPGTDPLLTIRYQEPENKEGEDAPDLQTGNITFRLGTVKNMIDGQPADDAEFRLDFNDFSLTLSGEDRDGFIRKILPDSGRAKINASFSLVYSALLNKFSIEGLDGNDGFLLLFNVNKKLFGKVEIPTLYLGIKPALGQEEQVRGVKIESSVMMKLHFGPVSMTVDRLGLDAELSFPEKADGNLGGADLKAGLKPPTGIGFLVKNRTVSGGGFLSIDPDNHQYYGAGELTVSLEKVELTLKVIGIIVTRLPDGKEGFSFLLAASVEFKPPYDLPLGFKLKGIGILAALHRTMNIQALQDAVRTEKFDSILFPDNPVGNAPAIVKTLNELFPVAEDRYVFSIMGRIGWGDSKLVDMKAGLFLEVPSPFKLALAGVVKVTVDEGGKRILTFQVNFLVALDLEKKIISVDAAIYDSKLLSFAIKGQLFLRYRWGNEPIFLLSLGGWHPAFEVPEGLNLPSKPERLTLPLLTDDNPSLVLSFYIAFTPNTIQAGFAIEFKMKWSKFRLEAGLSVDALFHRNPFYFIVDFEGKLRIFWGDSSLAGVTVKGEFSGTNPWRIRGKATFEIWIWDYDVDFDKSTGEKISSITQEAEILPLIEEAVRDRNNWQVLMPSAHSMQVIPRNTTEDISEDTGGASAAGVLLADPLSKLEVVQHVAPLGIRIDKVGIQRAKDFRKFDLVAENSGGPAAVNDFFAPAMFLDLEDAEKISRKSFERMNAGIAFGNADTLTCGEARVTPSEYEDIFYDPLYEEKNPEPKVINEDNFRRWIANTSIARSPLGRKKVVDLEKNLRKPQVKPDRFVLIDKISGKKIEEVPGQDSMTGAYYELWKIQKDHPFQDAGVIRESELVS